MLVRNDDEIKALRRRLEEGERICLLDNHINEDVYNTRSPLSPASLIKRALIKLNEP